MARIITSCLLCAVFVLNPGRADAQGKLPADLAFVPPDAAGFVHVRLADAWKSDFAKMWRESALAAGEKALTAFDERFFPRPSTLDRITVFADMPNGRDGRPGDPVIVLSTTKAIDRDAFLKRTLPGAEMAKTNEGTFLLDAKRRVEVFFIDDRTIAVSSPGGVKAVLARQKADKGNLSGALKQAQSGKPIVAAINPGAVPPAAFRDVPPPLQPLLKAEAITLSVELANEGQVELRASYSGAAPADDAAAAAKDAIKLARALLAKGRAEMEKKVFGNGKPGSLEELPEAAAALLALGAINRAEEFLTQNPMRKDGNDLHVAVKMPQGSEAMMTTSALAIGLLVPAVQKVREAASRAQSMNNLKHMAIGMHNHHDVYLTFPSAAICDKNGKPLLSWRVAILPFIEQKPLYDQFKLDEPWDSEHNKKLIKKMPLSYLVPGAPTKEGETYYRVFVEGGAGFEWSKEIRLLNITDGASNTIMIVEAGASVPWTKPDELVYDAKQPLPKLGNFHAQGFNAAFFDGSVRFLRRDIREQVLRALITRAGGEVVNPDDE